MHAMRFSAQPLNSGFFKEHEHLAMRRAQAGDNSLERQCLVADVSCLRSHGGVRSRLSPHIEESARVQYGLQW